MGSRKPKSMTKTVGKGWVGRWCDGSLEWFMPAHLVGGDRFAEAINERAREYAPGESFVLCRITVEQVFDKRGRPITRKVKP